MVEFQKVIEERHRMCEYYTEKDCAGCPFGVNAHFHDSDKLPLEQPNFVEKQVMEVSREHPPLVYPFARDVINMMAGKMKYDLRNGNIYEFMDMRLNKAAADYFGIKPINEDTLKSKI